jgi:hypothetical protein
VLVYTVSVNNPNLATAEVHPHQQAQTNGPVLGICWQEDAQSGYMPQKSLVLYIAHSDGTVKRWDIAAQGSQPQVVAQHTSPVKDVYSFNVNN